MAKHTTIFFCVALTATALVTSCVEDDALCQAGLCGPEIELEPDLEPVFDDSTCTPATAGLIAINEILADPSGTDINGDGMPDPYQDEFIELLNRTDSAIRLTGLSLRVNSRTVHLFGADCLAARAAIVVFGGGAPAGLVSRAIVADAALKLTNSGATVALVGSDGIDLLDAFSYDAAADGPHSLARNPDGVGTWAPHPEGGGAVAHSAGRCVNGSLFPACEPVEVIATDDDVVRADPPCPTANPGELVINEVLADPGPFDANGDGEAAWRNDEFIELVVSSEEPRSLDGVVVEVNDNAKATLGTGCREPGTTLILFGGGTPGLELGPMTSALVSDTVLGLTNDGAKIRLLTHDGVLLDAMSYGKEGGKDQSLTRFPDLTGPWVGHSETPSGTPASPGRCATGQPLWTGCMQDAEPDS
jgi:hypothetical protein